MLHSPDASPSGGGRAKRNTLAPILATCLACAGVALKPGGEKVQVVAGVPAGCQSLGSVFGKAGGSLSSGSMTSDERLADGAMNDARNKAAAKGATHLIPSGTEFSAARDAASVTGIAYRCAAP